MLLFLMGCLLPFDTAPSTDEILEGLLPTDLETTADGGVTGTMNGERITVYSGENARVPVGFPLPIPADGVLQSLTIHDEKSTSLVYHLPEGTDPKVVLGTYKAYFASHGVRPAAEYRPEYDGRVYDALSGVVGQQQQSISLSSGAEPVVLGLRYSELNRPTP